MAQAQPTLTEEENNLKQRFRGESCPEGHSKQTKNKKEHNGGLITLLETIIVT